MRLLPGAMMLEQRVWENLTYKEAHQQDLEEEMREAMRQEESNRFFEEEDDED